MKSQMDTDKAILMAAFARMDVVAFAIATGVIVALAIFSATVILVIKGAPPGWEVGPHLSLLGVYLPGYSVSYAGSVVGALYGLLIGSLLGTIIATLWNLTHLLYISAIVIRKAWLELMAD